MTKVRVRFSGQFEIDLPDETAAMLKAYDGSDPAPQIIVDWEEGIACGAPVPCDRIEVSDIS